MNISEELRARQEAVDALIEARLPAEEGFAAGLAEAANYSMRAGGKRLRPILLLESYRLFAESGASEAADAVSGAGDGIAAGHPAPRVTAEAFAVALEMIHTHSLVHDDLPAIDNDDLRRGRPATHAKFGEAAGVLAGDALLNLAYETALSAAEREADPRRAIRALRILAEKTGIRGMLGGQSVDVRNEKGGLSPDLAELNDIYRYKTAALLEAALMAGACLGGADETAISRAEQLGRSLGLAFQMRDDILDVTADEAATGKPAGSDERKGKTTCVGLLGLDAAEAEVKRLTDEALALASGLPGDTAFLRDLIRYLGEREH